MNKTQLKVVGGGGDGDHISYFNPRPPQRSPRYS